MVRKILEEFKKKPFTLGISQIYYKVSSLWNLHPVLYMTTGDPPLFLARTWNTCQSCVSCGNSSAENFQVVLCSVWYSVKTQGKPFSDCWTSSSQQFPHLWCSAHMFQLPQPPQLWPPALQRMEPSLLYLGPSSLLRVFPCLEYQSHVLPLVWGLKLVVSYIFAQLLVVYDGWLIPDSVTPSWPEALLFSIFQTFRDKYKSISQKTHIIKI